jgi:hypothetical protein
MHVMGFSLVGLWHEWLGRHPKGGGGEGVAQEFGEGTVTVV